MIELWLAYYNYLFYLCMYNMYSGEAMEFPGYYAWKVIPLC